MKIALIVAGVLIGVLILAVAAAITAGSRLPERHLISREKKLARTPAEVYATVRNIEAAPGWRSGLKTVEVLGETDGRLQYRETGWNGPITFELVEDVPGTRIVTRIVDVDIGFSGSWTYTFESDGERGTLVTITEDGEVSNLLFRFMSRYVFGHTATIDKYLADLSHV